MRNTERRSWSFADLGIRLVIFVLGALLLMALQLTGQLRAVQNVVTQVTSPAQVGATSATGAVADVIAFLFELGTLRQRNAELANINASLQAEIFRLSEVERQNNELRKYFQFAQERPGLELRGAQIVGRVIGQESTNFLEFLLLDLGQVHGIAIGMPVVTDQGLVGRISQVNSNTSKVLLITDVTSAVNALLQSSRVSGIVRGTSGGDLIMDFIQQGPVISVGEVVLTSGLGGRFPSGIPIGQVIEVRQRDVDIVQRAVVRPQVDFSRLELVAVVTNFDPLEELPALLGDVPLPVDLNGSAPLTTTEGLQGEIGPVDDVGEGSEEP
ncbi:MAG: rod shape-determining protein MreC [Chloroflexi bacterium]|nr:MAG: rod shape-determining protein MreC [Chloroflexota bacterium]